MSKNTWYWITIFLAIATAVVIFLVPENILPLSYLRSLLSIFLIMFLPGFALIKNFSVTMSVGINRFELLMLSVGLSIALVSIVGLILNYTPWGVRLAPVTFSLISLTIVLSTVALFRDFRQSQKNAKISFTA